MSNSMGGLIRSPDIDVDVEGQEEELITILSIDGGGMRGVIPAVILQALEEVLQEADENARIADYFEYIAGTSTGGIVTALLTTPKTGDNKPCAAKEIIGFYREEGPKIFDKERQRKKIDQEADDKMEKYTTGADAAWKDRVWRKLTNKVKKLKKSFIRNVVAAQYDSEILYDAIKGRIGTRFLADTKTNVVITAIDTKKLSPIIFSTQKAKTKHSEVRLADVVMGTTAAPCYFRPHKFNADNTEYNLVDGGLAANNPTLVAVLDALKAMTEETTHGRKKFLILSIGTGSKNDPEKYYIEEGGKLDWIFQYNDGMVPLIDCLMRASDSMVVMYTPLLLANCNLEENFLRIQENALDPNYAELDNATPENIDNLETTAKELLDKKASNVTLIHDSPEEKDTTNRQEIRRFAEKLVRERERKMREKQKQY